MINECINDWFFKNEELHPVAQFDTKYLQSGNFYEVIRVSDNIPLFLEDHLERFRNSIKEKQLIDFAFSFNYRKIINELALHNKKSTGNIKILLTKTNKPELCIYFIAHSYPTTEQYSNGVKLTFLKAERNNPEIKAVNLDLRQKAEEILKSSGYYEIILVNNEGYITEGHKSNFFLIKGNCVYSAPSELILAGITRKYVLALCKKNNFNYCESKISETDLNNFESAFITGTSPKILPVHNINNIPFDVKNSILRRLMEDYDKIIHSITSK